MRILITNTGPWGTGSFTVAKGLLDAFLEMGHEVKLFFPDSEEPSPELEYYYSRPEIYEIWKLPIEKNGMRIDSFPLMITDPHPRNPLGNTYKDLSDNELQFYLTSFEERIKGVLEEFKPHIVECQHIWAYDHVIKKLGYPFIATTHNSDQIGFRYDPRMRPLAIDSAKHAKFIFSISKQNREDVLSLYGVDPEKVVYIQNSYDHHVFKPMNLDRKAVFKELQLDIPEDAFVVSFAGKISKTKGIDTILQAQKLLDHYENLHLIIMGSGKLEKALTGVALETTSTKNTHFVGHQTFDNVARLHNLADISMMPSRTEGFGLSCLEAMGCRLPLIVSRCGGPEDFAVGEIIDKENPQQLADAILKLMRLTKTELDALAQRALEKAQESSWANIAKQRIGYYERAIEVNELSLSKDK